MVGIKDVHERRDAILPELDELSLDDVGEGEDTILASDDECHALGEGLGGRRHEGERSRVGIASG